jgi:hypothetical protein
LEAGLGLEPWGTLLYALCTGPLAQFFPRVFAVPSETGSTVVAAGPSKRAILPR